VTCSLEASGQRLDVRVRDARERIDLGRLPGLPDRIERELRRELSRIPAEVEIERRIDAITIVDRTEGGLAHAALSPFDFGFGNDRACRERPAVTATDSIRLRLGRHSDGANLLLDLRYGRLEPGITDEGDGGSEIEVDARLGHGQAAVRLTRDADAFAVERPQTTSDPGPVRVNLNAGEAVADRDLLLGRHSRLAVLGAGGDDLMTSAGGRGDPDELIPPTLAGGQGADTLTGGRGSELFWGGAGVDSIDAGPGFDAIAVLERAVDALDCGPGRDIVITLGQRLRLPPSCERLIDLTAPESVVAAEPQARQMLRRVRELRRVGA
jgi:hemolysin type calcium-binding protein